MLIDSNTVLASSPSSRRHVYDWNSRQFGRIGIGVDFDLFHFEVAWVGIRTENITANVGYLITGSTSPNTVVLTLSRQF